MKRALLITVSWLLLTSQTAVPTPTPSPTPSPTPAPGTEFANAKPYSDDEFPDWALKLRRFEIIAVGAFPIAYLFAGLGYDYVYYFSNGMPSSNAPWPAGTGTSSWTTTNNYYQLQRKNWTNIGVAAGISLLLATADYLLGLDHK